MKKSPASAAPKKPATRRLGRIASKPLSMLGLPAPFGPIKWLILPSGIVASSLKLL